MHSLHTPAGMTPARALADCAAAIRQGNPQQVRDVARQPLSWDELPQHVLCAAGAGIAGARAFG